jgi:hypothetical protein
LKSDRAKNVRNEMTMKANDFRRYLSRKGKQEHVVENLLSLANEAQKLSKKDLDTFKLVDLERCLQAAERQQVGSGSKLARALALYFAMAREEELKSAAAAFRESAISKTRSTFALKNFLGIERNHLKKLGALHILNTEQLLACTRTKPERMELAQRTHIPYAAILELVKLSDLSRLPGVKGIRARLYYDAGIDTVEKMADWEPEALVETIREFVKRTNFRGVPTLPQEARSTIKTARELPKRVEFAEDE